MLLCLCAGKKQLSEVSGALFMPHAGIRIERSNILQEQIDIIATVVHIRTLIITMTRETFKIFTSLYIPAYFFRFTSMRFVKSWLAGIQSDPNIPEDIRRPSNDFRRHSNILYFQSLRREIVFSRHFKTGAQENVNKRNCVSHLTPDSACSSVNKSLKSWLTGTSRPAIKCLSILQMQSFPVPSVGVWSSRVWPACLKTRPGS